MNLCLNFQAKKENKMVIRKKSDHRDEKSFETIIIDNRIIKY